MLQMETTNQLTISVKLIPSDSIQWKKKNQTKKQVLKEEAVSIGTNMK